MKLSSCKAVPYCLPGWSAELVVLTISKTSESYIVSQQLECSIFQALCCLLDKPLTLVVSLPAWFNLTFNGGSSLRSIKKEVEGHDWLTS